MKVGSVKIIPLARALSFFLRDFVELSTILFHFLLMLLDLHLHFFKDYQSLKA
jgi:hypothetical protein